MEVIRPRFSSGLDELGAFGDNLPGGEAGMSKKKTMLPWVLENEKLDTNLQWREADNV